MVVFPKERLRWYYRKHFWCISGRRNIRNGRVVCLTPYYESTKFQVTSYIFQVYSGNKVKYLLCAIICMHSFCPSLKYFPNVKIFLTGVEIWTNKSQQDRKRSQPPKRNFSVFFYFVDPENGRVWERRTFLDKFFSNLNMR